ncbi:MAG: sulfotransferase [Myxococcales bacterium]|nr:sulfotransferase [Myxococcales bacterium]MCB9709456.1 sulfotransferase [Myxococcales bacterium]
MQESLVFVVSPPRSGSTLLQRMLASHTEVFTHPEPHLITPLAYLGYYDTVDKAPYDHINSAEAMRLFVNGLPHKEADYLDALRAYADTLYGRMLQPSGRRFFLDKTPAYALVLPFLAKLYPSAHYVVLTRHPLAIMSSYANSFFNGDWSQAHDYNPILLRYVPQMARFLREKPTPLIHVTYEALVAQPEHHLKRIFEFLGLAHQPDAVDYGKHAHENVGPGDPITVSQYQRPVTTSVETWTGELAADPAKLALARQIVQSLDPSDLATWGVSKDTIFEPVEQYSGRAMAKRKPSLFNSHTLQRRILLALRKDIHRRPLGKAVRKVRYYCNVLLRE